MSLRPFYVVLLHYPMVNRNGNLVTTAVTNMDIHDIARSSRTFGAKGYFIVTPIEDQHELVGRILAHWRSDHSREYHPDRVEAVSLVRLAKSFDEVKAAIRAEHGEDPEVVLTDARPFPNSISYSDYRRELGRPDSKKPVAICFGTGWGISDVFYPEVHRILAPVYGPEGAPREGVAPGYNHLSVRAAVAIILDRLFGQ
ncbi:MAG: RNA methyltransferase [Oligoflexia bacterium]|nr:RNA methyltransferase [Oligoflexia bacterium]